MKNARLIKCHLKHRSTKSSPNILISAINCSMNRLKCYIPYLLCPEIRYLSIRTPRMFYWMFGHFLIGL